MKCVKAVDGSMANEHRYNRNRLKQAFLLRLFIFYVHKLKTIARAIVESGNGEKRKEKGVRAYQILICTSDIDILDACQISISPRMAVTFYRY